MTNGSILKCRIPFLDQLPHIKIKSKSFIILCAVLSVVLILFTYLYTIPLYDNTAVSSYVFKAGYNTVRYKGSQNESLVKKSKNVEREEKKDLRENIDIVVVKPLELKVEETIEISSENDNLIQVDIEHEIEKIDNKVDEGEDNDVNDGSDVVDGEVGNENSDDTGLDDDNNVVVNKNDNKVGNDKNDDDNVGVDVVDNGDSVIGNDENDDDDVVDNDEDGNGDDVVDDEYEESDGYSVEIVSEAPKQSNISTIRINSVNAGFQWNDTRLDILHMRKPKYDKKFKNPCWYELLDTPTPYKGNIYATISPSAKTVLGRLSELWDNVYSDDEPSYRLRCLPYFMIIGQPKCGTTDLFWKIAKHSDITTPPIKELHWWSRSRQGRRFSYSKIIPFDDYVDMFDASAVSIEQRFNNITDDENIDINKYNNESRNQIITGEASVSLFWDNTEWMYFPENKGQSEPLYIIPHYIHHIIPNVKLILMLRDPVERMYSDYLYFHSIDKSADNFHEAVVYAIDIYSKCFTSYSVRQCIYDTSLANKVRVRLRIGIYSSYLKDWLKLFPLSQFFTLRLEDYSSQQVDILEQIYEFLDMRPLSSKEKERIQVTPMSNVRKDEDKQLGGMYEKTRKLLQQFYKPFNVELASLLDDNRYLWSDV
ncbi:Carbohydrate sulfotransferase 15 [Mactra antiquata]